MASSLERMDIRRFIVAQAAPVNYTSISKCIVSGVGWGGGTDAIEEMFCRMRLE
jgi:ADP-ribosylglycohydrolase